MNPQERMDQSPANEQEWRRAAAEIASHLHARGVDVRDDDEPEELTTLLEVIEAFERLVVRKGGDLMVDEPPRGQDAQPDDVHFVLPTRRADESISAFRERVLDAADAVRGHQDH